MCIRDSYYPFYSYHPLPQLTIEQQLGEFAHTNGSLLCIGEKRDFGYLNTSERSSVRGRCELLGETGDTPGRAVFRIHPKDWRPVGSAAEIK